MKMVIARCELAGGPADGKRFLFVRPPDLRVGAMTFYLRAEEQGDVLRYDLAGDTPDSKGWLYKSAGVEPPAPPDDDGDEAPDAWPGRGVDVAAPDGTPARKVRLFFDGGPADGLHVFILSPRELMLVNLDLDMESEGEGDGRTHCYQRLPAWKEPADLAPDALVYTHVLIEAAPATEADSPPPAGA